MNKITTYRAFFKAIRKLRKRGSTFSFCIGPRRTRNSDGEGWVSNRTIWTKSYTPNGELCLSPFQLIYREFFGGLTEGWLGSTMAASRIGLPPKKYKELEAAQLETGGHILALRKRLLAACDLEEVPHRNRKTFQKRWKNGCSTSGKCKA